MSQPCATVVIPCFNEGQHLELCLERVLREPCVSQVILVDDGSTDGSLDIARGYLSDERIQLLVHSVNLGKGAALRTAFSSASSAYVIPQDADLEQDPSDYESLIQPLRNGLADVVFGTRFPDHRRLPNQRRTHFMANRLLTFLSNLLTGLELTDMETGYKVFRREVLEDLTIEEDRFGVEPELAAKIAKGGWRVFEVPVSYRPRSSIEGKKIGWRDGFRTLYCIFRYSDLSRGKETSLIG